MHGYKTTQSGALVSYAVPVLVTVICSVYGVHCIDLCVYEGGRLCSTADVPLCGERRASRQACSSG